MDARVAIHAALTAVMAWLALVLALPGDTFENGRSYAVLASMMTEDHWAMAFWLVANIGMVGVTTCNRTLRLGSVLVLATMNGVVAVCLLLANPTSTGSGTYGVLAALGYYLVFRRTREGLT